MAALLAIDGLTVRFGGLVAVDDFSLEVAAGTIHALIGPNGAGKSTVLNAVSRFYQPAAGSIRFAGQELTRLPPHAIARLGIARTFQNLELFGGVSVLENVLLGMHARLGGRGTMLDVLGRRAARRAAADEAHAILERVGLADYGAHEAKALDFGRQKLLELARALAARPRLLLLDEPAAGLRNREIAELDALLVQLSREQGITVLLIEHVMPLVMSISDRITVLNFGSKIAEGTPASIRSHEEVVRAYLGGAAHA